MRMIIGLTAAVALAGSGFVAGWARPAAAAIPVAPATPADEPANHDLSFTDAIASTGTMPQQAGGIPASAGTAAARIAAARIAVSPRHAEWVAITVNAGTTRESSRRFRPPTPR